MTIATTPQLLTFGSRAEWLAARRELGVGSSEIAALFSNPEAPLRGLSKWASPLSLSWEKRGLTERPETDEEIPLWGSYMEPVIAQWFDDRIREEVEPLSSMIDPGRFAIYLPADGAPWFASVDRILLSPGGEPCAVVEIKNASHYMGDEWEGEPPLPYLLQVQQQLAILGFDRGYVTASIGGAPPKWAKVKRDDELIAILRQRAIDFWAAVKAEVDPPVDGSDSTAKALIARWPQDNEQRIALPADAAEEWDRRTKLHEEIGELEYRKAQLTNTLKHRIGENSMGDLPDGRSLSLRTDKAGRRNLREVARRG